MNLTNNIFSLSAPYDNQWQGPDKRLLFVCSAGLLRSATAANLFAKKGYNTRNCGTHEYALIPLTSNLIYWAHKIYFTNHENKDKALNTFDTLPNEYRWIQDADVLDLPDQFAYNDPELIRLLEERVKV